MAQSKIQMPETKTILNIALAIGIFVVGKKLMETFGLLDTKDDVIAQQLEDASGGNVQDTSTNAPAGLSLNPNYWKNIYASFNVIRKKQNLPNLTGAEIQKSLTFDKIPYVGFKFMDFFSFFALQQLYNITKIYDKAKFQEAQSKAGITSNKAYDWLRAYVFNAYMIYNSKGLIKDNPEIINGIFQKLKSRSQVSYLSMLFTKIYNIDLQTYLASFLNTTEMTKLANYLKNKPMATN